MVGLDEEVQIGPLPRRLALPFSDAIELAAANGEDLGYPWVDPLTDELVLSAATPRGRQLIEGAAITIPHRIRDVPHGIAELERIQDDVMSLRPGGIPGGVPGAELIVETLPDYRDNRALVVLSGIDPELLAYLAERYPPDALAIQVDPESGGA
jgi:hypothetical protein